MTQNNTRNKQFGVRIFSREFQFILDLVVLCGAFFLAYLLRFEFQLPSWALSMFLNQLPLVILIQFAALYFTGAQSFVWRYVGLSEVKAFLYAAALSFSVILFIRLGLPWRYSWKVPISIIFLNTFLGFGGTLGLRVCRRLFYEHYEKQQNGLESRSKKKKPVLLIGAGRAGVIAAKEITGRGNMNLEIKGFVDDDPEKKGRLVQGIKVLGDTKSLPELVEKYEIDHLIVTIAKATRKEFRQILDVCEKIPIKVRTIPALYEILQGNVRISRIRDVDIEDLLGREPVQLEEDLINRFLTGKRVMITGAGGSIGSELARQVARFEPAHLLLAERAEFVLFDIDRELKGLWPGLSILPLVADVSDASRMRHLLTHHRPEIIFHAAAHKHVPMMEHNPTEAIKNNILASRLLGELAGESGVQVFVMISTDKAVNPTSIMGASKRIAELVVQDLNGKYKTHYLAVRFGNVLGSAGSVIPIFKEQISKGGPLTITDPAMKRYFMTIPEASQLVLQAGAMGQGGEIFILDMGEPVSIMNLAKDMITLSGLKPGEDIEMVCTGIRPGEKLFEELECSEETLNKTRHPKIYIGKIKPYPEEKITQALKDLAHLSQNGHVQELRRYINEFLPEARIAE